MPTPTIAQLKQAITLAEQIEKLQTELAGLVGGSASAGSAPKAAAAASTKKKGKRTMSPETIAKMRAAQQARWASKKGPILNVLAPLDAPSKSPKGKAAKAPKKRKTGLTPEGRAKLAASMKARWAAKKKAAK